MRVVSLFSFCYEECKLIMARGRSPKYHKPDGSKFDPPTSGWSKETLNESNPPYKYLADLLRSNAINPRVDHVKIYQAHHQLQVINPCRFKRFFFRTVKIILGIDLDEEEKSGTTSTLSSASSFTTNPSTFSTTPSTSTGSSATSTSDYPASINMSSTDSSSFGGRHADNDFKVIINDKGMPCSLQAYPVDETSPHTVVKFPIVLVPLRDYTVVKWQRPEGLSLNGPSVTIREV